VARRETRGTIASAVGNAVRVRNRATGIIDHAAAIARKSLLSTVRQQVAPMAGRIAAGIGHGLAPLPERAGRAPMTPVARKPQVRRAAGMPTAKKKATPRPISARKQAERRVASKRR
jgi:hypothetical protein